MWDSPSPAWRAERRESWGREEHLRDVVAGPVGLLVEFRGPVSHHHHAPGTEKQGRNGEKRGSWGPCPAQGPHHHHPAPHCLEAGHARNLEAQSGLSSLPTSPSLDFTSHASQPLLLRFPLPGAPAPPPLPTPPGDSRDLLQDGEHPAPRAGPARDECFVVHDHPLVVVPARPKQGGLSRPWGYGPGLPLPAVLHTARNHRARVAWGCLAIWSCSRTRCAPALLSAHCLPAPEDSMAPQCLLEQRSLLPHILSPSLFSSSVSGSQGPPPPTSCSSDSRPPPLSPELSSSKVSSCPSTRGLSLGGEACKRWANAFPPQPHFPH